MGRIKLSKDSAMKAITYSKEAYENLAQNARIMDQQVNNRFIGLKDPAYVSYLELSMQMQELLGQVGNKMEAVSDYCQSVIRWIDTYNDH